VYRSYCHHYFWKYGQILVDQVHNFLNVIRGTVAPIDFSALLPKFSITRQLQWMEDSGLLCRRTFGKGGRWRETSLHLHGQIPGNTLHFFMVTHWRNFNFFQARGLLPGNMPWPPDRLSASFCYLVPTPGLALKNEIIQVLNI